MANPIIFSKNSSLLPLIRQKVDKLRKTLISKKLTPWRWFNSRGIKVDRFDGETIDISGCLYGQSQALVFFDFIVPFLKNAIVKTLDETLEICRVRGLKPEEPYIRESAMVLSGHLIHPIYDEIVDIDRHLRGKGAPKSVGRRDVTDEITQMDNFLCKTQDEMISGIEEREMLKTQQIIGEMGDETKKKPEAEQNSSINIQNFQGVLGNIQAENVQTGNHSVANKYIESEKKKSVLRKLLGIIGAIILAIIATIVVDVLGHFGLLEGIYSIFSSK